jgi:transcriptional regulator with XRE-family HTH domain
VYVPATALARWRIRAGVTQRELARQLGIHPSTLSSVENAWRPAWPKLREDCARILGYPELVLFPPDERVRP